ncbi:uncharacterized protein [Physcomitrium patens]|uniref:WLM domain-containing protein n=1 Tax=Physcomitrium patens TaxID=3218 RepID=A0A7I4C742_PHYPA|nr:uncharacterized protein LOC112273378 isoform X2 [Physcomitrium patens]|eukprot:XP_024357843.1 uncharacterized protein LOC112273378 isoform X2 [Physcomitrella patens]
MEVERDKMTVSVVYRGKPYTAEVSHDATVGELGKQLSHLTGVALHTMRLLLPRGRQSRFPALLPASEQHSFMTLKSAGISTGIVLRMMGATAEEVKEVSQPPNKRVDGRVIGFDEEERREKLRSGVGTRIQLPKGPYSFSDFRTLALPGIELHPPPHKALAIMHKLASDPGIVAIMNKHRWQVGVMTEMAPVGYVGISPKCLLGFNKNRGQEISLRLRTDDLRGFRKYESMKKTLLHELAHMVHDEHDEHFHALDKQLNQEAIALDWTKSAGHTLNGSRFIEDDDSPMDVGGVSSGHKLGGISLPSSNIRSTAAQAAIMRLEQNKQTSELSKADVFATAQRAGISEPDPDESMVHRSTSLPSWSSVEISNEPDPDEIAGEIVVTAEGQATGRELNDQNARMEPDPDDALQHSEEPDPDENTSSPLNHALLPVMDTRSRIPGQVYSRTEPDPDNLSIDQKHTSSSGFNEPDPDDMLIKEEATQEPDPDERMEMVGEPDPDESLRVNEEPDPDASAAESGRVEPDPDENARDLDLGMVDGEIARIQDSTAAAMARLQNAITTLKRQASPSETNATIQVLFTIFRNVIDHPNEDKYRRLRKGQWKSCKPLASLMEGVL